MSHNSSTNSIDPVFFFFIGVGNEIHIAIIGGDFKGKRFVNCIFSSFDGKAFVNFDDSARFCILQEKGSKEKISRRGGGRGWFSQLMN
jgi:hypothetical protein